MNNTVFDEPNYDKKVQVFSKGTHEYFMKNKAKELIKLIRPDDRKKLLDIGCGTGEFETFVYKYFDKIVGIDCSKEMIKNATIRNLPNCNFLVKNAEYFCLNKSFDFIVLVNVLHHIASKKKILKILQNAKNHLKKKGQILIYEHNSLNPYTQYIVKTSDIDVDARILFFGNLRKILKATGFVKLQMKFIHFFPKELASLNFIEKYINFIPLGGDYLIIAKK